MVSAVRSVTPDHILHLGDGASDATALHAQFPHIPLQAVRGNCDFGGTFPLLNGLDIAGKHIVMTHGHRYGVKSGYAGLIRMGQEMDADILLFGHTHIAHYEELDGMHILNPGPACAGYGLIQIKDGEISCALIAPL